MSNRPHLRPVFPNGDDGVALMGPDNQLHASMGLTLIQQCVLAHSTGEPQTYGFGFRKDGQPVNYRVTVEVVPNEDDP